MLNFAQQNSYVPFLLFPKSYLVNSLAYRNFTAADPQPFFSGHGMAT